MRAVAYETITNAEGGLPCLKPMSEIAGRLSAVYIVDEVVHYGVTNMPGAVARSSTLALTSTTLNYGLAMAEAGLATSMREDPGLRAGLNLFEGSVTHEAVASSLDMEYMPARSVLRD